MAKRINKIQEFLDEKDIDALFVGGCQDRIMTFTELKHRIIMLGKYRKELDELDAFEKTNNKIKGQK
mgnify:CR=1 FL=1